MLSNELRHSRKGDVEVIYSGELRILELPIPVQPVAEPSRGVLMRRGRPYEIAIIGMGCRFPGASDLTAYFENISLRDNGGTREVPLADRLGRRAFCDPNARANDRVSSRLGGYLDSPIPFETPRALTRDQGWTIEGGEPEQFLCRTPP